MPNRMEENRYITPVNIVFALINVVVYVVLEILGDTTDAMFMYDHGAMYPYAVLMEGQWYRLLTSSFLHFGLVHLVNNLILLICLGSYLERRYGKVRYVILYLVCAVGGSLASMWHMLYTQNIAVSAGASGVVFGMVGALLFLVLQNKGRFEDLSLRRFLLMMALALYNGFATAGVDNAAHVGGLIVGFVVGAVFFALEKIRNGSKRNNKDIRDKL
ncbi:MAG: rhomboid family intramembrane serine protease [Clostridiales bacterium]|nr:rhomboid family intramembrane serine protease [Clostridiales bacterium]